MGRTLLLPVQKILTLLGTMHCRIAFFFLFLTQLQLSTCQYYLEDKACAVLYSEGDFQGRNFTLKDRGQTVDLAEDHEASNSQWNSTGSIKIEGGCKLQVCDEIYFDGTCNTVPHGSYPDPASTSINFTDIASARCNCDKECKCSDIYMKRSSCARGYLNTGGCNTCNSNYTDLLQEGEESFSDFFVGQVKALRIRKGCELILYPEQDYKGEPQVFDSEVVEDYDGEFWSYECECDDSKFEPRVKPDPPSHYPPLIDIPLKLDDVVQMLRDDRYAKHPGLRSAHMSLRKGRSSRNAYILLIGSTGSGKSSAVNILFDKQNLTAIGDGPSTTTDILEFRVPVPIDEIGVGNSELRIIDTPGMGDTRGLVQDATFLATLDSYLTNHEELKDRIPNVVLFFNKFVDNRFDGEGSHFVKMLRGIDSFRERITDKEYSNVIFVMTYFMSVTKQQQRRPETRLLKFKSVIENYSLFPKPIILSVAENKAKEQDGPMINGYFKLPNNEYYPQNLFGKMELVAKKSGDMIGLGVLRSAFRDSDEFNVTCEPYRLINSTQKIQYYLQVITNALFSIEKSEVSQILKTTWEDDNKIDISTKKRYPGSLKLLQRALSVRNINTMKDVPVTTTEILKLLMDIKKDDATLGLLQKGLQIEAPHFPQNTIAGFSYDVLKDHYLLKSPFKMESVQGSDIAFLIPDILSCNLNPSSKQHFYIFENREEYIKHRLHSLGIVGTIANETFKGRIKPGYNIKEVAFKDDGCSLTATQEFRLFDFVLQDRPDFTPEFEETVRGLPVFDNTDFESVEIWRGFFNDYGTHVVKSIHGGGAIQIKLQSDKPYDNRLTQGLFELVQFAEEMSFPGISIDEKSSNVSAIDNTTTVLLEGITHSLSFSGGNAAYHTTDLTKMSIEEASKLLRKWKESIKFNPTLLTTEMRLLPISQIVRKLGRNYSSEIERASAVLLEVGGLKPDLQKDTETGPSSRADTQLMNVFLKMQAESNERINRMMLEMKQLDVANEMRRVENEERRRQWEQDQMIQEREFKRQIMIAERESGDKRAQRVAEIEKMRLEHQSMSASHQAASQQAMFNMMLKTQETSMNVLADIVKRTQDQKEGGGGGGCLKQGTKILMADLSEKSVESLKVGDLIMDKDLRATKVLGVSFELLMKHKFFGFDRDFFFFTDSHLFVGPSERSELELYAQSLPEVHRLNPLMEYMNVSEFDIHDGTTLFRLQQQSDSGDSPFLGAKSVVLQEDPNFYSPDTPIYFLIVDSPTGTYFANGYVCRHDVPPLEIWPHTMGLFFLLAETPTFQQYSQLPFNPATVTLIEEVTDLVTKAVQNHMSAIDFQSWGNAEPSDPDDETFPVMTLFEINLEESITKAFDNPAVSSLSIGLYAKVGRVISPYLDSVSYGKEDIVGSKMGLFQREIFKLILTELQRYFNFVESI